MPSTYACTFGVRHYECNPSGCARHACYLNYMQEAAIAASAAAGYSLARYEAMGRLWLARETDLHVVHPLRYGDAVEVTTWVADMRRVRSCRRYDLRLAGSGEPVARAHTDWVFLDSTSGHPAAIPQAMMEAFLPGGMAGPAAARAAFPPPSPPPGAFRLRLRAARQDADPVGHVNNAVYLDYVDDCLAQARGWDEAPAAARHVQIEYRQPAVPGDELELAAWACAEAGSQVWHCTVQRVGDGALLARARSAWGEGEPNH